MQRETGKKDLHLLNAPIIIFSFLFYQQKGTWRKTWFG